MNRLDQLLTTMAGYATRTCIECDGFSYTYAQILDEIGQWNRRLDTWKVTPGTVVGLCGDYSLQMIAAILATTQRRAVAALIPRGGESSRYLSDACAAVFIDARTPEHLQLSPTGILEPGRDRHVGASG